MDPKTQAPTPDLVGDPSEAELAEAIRRLARTNVLVIGDAMLDRYVYGDVQRVSPEAPVSVLAVQRELTLPGGAGNVVRNLGALGAAVAFVAVVGDDQAGSDLTGLIGGQPGVEPWLLVQGGRTTTMKTRFIAQGETSHAQHLLRADREDTRPVHPKLMERLLRIARDGMAATSVTILSDYRKGVLAGDIPTRLILEAKQAGRRIVADLRGDDFDRYGGADLVIASSRTLHAATGMQVNGDDDLAAAAQVLIARQQFGAMLITRGNDGMSLVDAAGAAHFRAESEEVFDVSGVGDTVVATLAAGLAGGLETRLAARIASIAAGVVVGRSGTAVAREVDLLAAISPHAGALRKIVTPDVAAARAARWRRNGWRIGFTDGGFDQLTPGHRHLLEQARAACDRLVVGLHGDADLRRATGSGAAQPEAVRAAELASQPCVDLVVVHSPAAHTELLRALRPNVLVNGSRTDGAEIVAEWGGQVLLAERLAQPVGD